MRAPYWATSRCVSEVNLIQSPYPCGALAKRGAICAGFVIPITLLIAACGGGAGEIEGRALPEGCDDETAELDADGVLVLSEDRIRVRYVNSSGLVGCAIRVDLSGSVPAVIPITVNPEYATADEHVHCLEVTVPTEVTDALGEGGFEDRSTKGTLERSRLRSVPLDPTEVDPPRGVLCDPVPFEESYLGTRLTWQQPPESHFRLGRTFRNRLGPQRRSCLCLNATAGVELHEPPLSVAWDEKR